jgi:hypothetical protein
MDKLHSWLFFLFIIMVAGSGCFSPAQAQDEVYRLAHTEIFGELRRPAIEFNHETHVEALGEPGCGVCHHSPDPDTGKLTYAADEEVSCSECHGASKQDDAPALREAYHGSCTLCHRRMLKSNQAFKGPTTCGECHRPDQAK